MCLDARQIHVHAVDVVSDPLGFFFGDFGEGGGGVFVCAGVFVKGVG